MRAFVTGGTGFVGINLIHLLEERGWDVVATHRASSDLRWLEQTGATLVVGDVTSAQDMRSAMPSDLDAVFHVAGDTSFWAPNNARQTRINVEGTRNVVAAALESGAKKLIHTSSISAFGPEDGDHVHEDTPSKSPGHWIHYYRTKWEAEQEVDKGIAQGLDASLINPASVLGPHDANSWGRSFLLVRDGKLAGAPPGGCAWNHVRHVCEAHLAAVERGGTGERYLLPGPVVSFPELLADIARLMGKPPLRAIPGWVMGAVGRVSDWGSRLTGVEPDMTPELVSVLTSTFSVASDKAERVLGYRQAELAEMLEDTHRWLVDSGHL